MEGAGEAAAPGRPSEGRPLPAVGTGLPGELTWLGEAAGFESGPRALSVSAGPATDWFIDPGSGRDTLSAPALVFRPAHDFTLSARVEVDFAATFDAGALVVWEDERSWAKLAYEMSPDGQPMIVSVVTRGWSDDCNSVPVGGGRAWLRVARIASAYAFHASMDGQVWQFVRHFRLSGGDDALVGLEAQSPTGEGCRARFSDISVTAATLSDMRNGA